MRIYQPKEKLRPYVRYYWVLESDKPFCVLTFPIGCPQMISHTIGMFIDTPPSAFYTQEISGYDIGNKQSLPTGFLIVRIPERQYR